jgi:hypothetical protein
VAIDWTIRRTVRARLRVLVKRILRRRFVADPNLTARQGATRNLPGLVKRRDILATLDVLAGLGDRKYVTSTAGRCQDDAVADVDVSHR